MAVPSEPITPSPADGATDVSVDLLKLDWANSTDADSYRVRIATASPPAYEIPVSLTSSEVTLAPLAAYINLSPGTKYYWQVTAIGAGAEETPSQIWSFTTKHKRNAGAIIAMAAAMRRNR